MQVLNDLNLNDQFTLTNGLTSSLMMKNNFFTNLVANDYLFNIADNKGNYNHSGALATTTGTLSRSSSTCSLINAAVNSSSSNASSSPPNSISPSTVLPPSASTSKFPINAFNQPQQKSQLINNFFHLQQRNNDQDIDWNVYQNAEKYLLRDDTLWINKLNKEFWWNMSQLTDLAMQQNTKQQSHHMAHLHQPQVINNSHARLPRKICGGGGNINNNRMMQTQSAFNGYSGQQLLNNKMNVNKMAAVNHHQQQQQQQFLLYQQQQQQQRIFNGNNNRFFPNNMFGLPQQA